MEINGIKVWFFKYAFSLQSWFSFLVFEQVFIVCGCFSPSKRRCWNQEHTVWAVYNDRIYHHKSPHEKTFFNFFDCRA